MELWWAFICDDPVRINYPTSIIIASQDQIPRVVVVREPDLVLRDEPVREMGEV